MRTHSLSARRPRTDTLSGMQPRSTPQQTSWLSVCALASAAIVGIAAVISQQRTIRQQTQLLSQSQKLLVSRDSMTFQALNLPEAPSEPDLGIIDDRETEQLTAGESFFDGIDPLTAGVLRDAGAF